MYNTLCHKFFISKVIDKELKISMKIMKNVQKINCLLPSFVYKVLKTSFIEIYEKKSSACITNKCFSVIQIIYRKIN